METPSSLRQATVEPQSAPVEKLVISERPSARAAIRAARCEIDLSPGSRSRPWIERAGVSLMVSAYVRQATLGRRLCYKRDDPANKNTPRSRTFPTNSPSNAIFLTVFEPVSAILYPTVL